MSILSSFKKALGFPDEFEEEDDLDSDFEQTEDKQKHAAPKTERADDIAATATNPPTETSFDSALPGEVFDAVIELFNATQPDFVSKCLSVEKQREYLMERINKSLRDRLAAESENARRNGAMQWEAEKRRMTGDVEKLRSEYHSLKQQREEFQSAQLSAARQKRALSERIHDLENQVSTLESDREQLQLENRSMINKLRVANVRNASDDADTEAQNKRLAQENVDLTDRVKELQSELNKQNQASSTLQKENGNLKAETEKFKAETESLRIRIEAMQEELDKAAADVDKQTAIAEIEATLQEFEKIKARKDKKISDLTVENSRLTNEVKAAGTKMITAEKAVAESKEEISRLRLELDTIRKEAVETSEQLREEIKRLTRLINETETERASQPKKSRHSKKRNKENALSVQEPVTPPLTAVTEDIQPENTETPTDDIISTTVKISAIDELMDSTDWFTAPEPTPLKKDPEVEDFGYKEPPVKKVSRDEDKQLSLW